MSTTPIFVLGRHRSGTTWLSNIIASFPEVYAPMHELHRGIHESAFFSHLVPYCNAGRTPADLLAIKHLFEHSDYFLLTRLQEGPDIVRHGYTRYFRGVLDAAARRDGAKYWLEKTPAHTLLARFLATEFPDAILLAIARDAREVVASNVHGFGNPHSIWAWFRQAAVTAIYAKVLAQNKVFVIRYEDLRDRHAATVAEIAKRLALCESTPRANTYAPNTSYKEHVPRLEWWQRAAIGCGLGVVQVWPARWVEFAVLRWHARKTGVLPKWFFVLGARANADDS